MIILQAKSRQASAGLGTKGSSYDIGPVSSYKEAVKKTMIARFQEMEDEWTDWQNKPNSFR